jgi:hypothetical protein
MRIPNQSPQMICRLALFIACSISTYSYSLPQGDPAKDKASPQEKKSDEKTPGTTAQRGGFEILSDTGR